MYNNKIGDTDYDSDSESDFSNDASKHNNITWQLWLKIVKVVWKVAYTGKINRLLITAFDSESKSESDHVVKYVWLTLGYVTKSKPTRNPYCTVLK